jgi:hypothetical protein
MIYNTSVYHTSTIAITVRVPKLHSQVHVGGTPHPVMEVRSKADRNFALWNEATGNPP